MRFYIFLILVIAFSFNVSAAICGDNICDAGQYLEGSGIEDASTCYEDCKFIDYTSCSINSAQGGDCSFQGTSYGVGPIFTNGCSKQINNLSISFEGHEREFTEVSSRKYLQLSDDVYFMVDLAPCSTYVSKRGVYFRKSLPFQQLNNIAILSDSKLHKSQGDSIEAQYSLPLNVSAPYCKITLSNLENGEEITSPSGYGLCIQGFSYDISRIDAGKYGIRLEYFDESVENLLGEDERTLFVSECEFDDECKDGLFYTSDSCFISEEIGMCKSKTNWFMWGGLLIGLLIVVLAFVMRRVKS